MPNKPTTVRELITALQKLDQDMHVLTSNECGYRDATLPENDEQFNYTRNVYEGGYFGPHLSDEHGEHKAIFIL